jgi:hypothetical protein
MQLLCEKAEGEAHRRLQLSRPVKKRKIKEDIAQKRRSHRLNEPATALALASRNKCYESDEIPQFARPLKKPKGSTEESKSYSRKATPAFFSLPPKIVGV